MEELDPEQLRVLEEALLALRDRMDELLAGTKEESRPVDLDQPIGRLSRMDAIQQQKMAAASRQNAKRRREQIQKALSAIAEGEYGDCRRCEEPIGFARLEARPETPFCLECQGASERR